MFELTFIINRFSAAPCIKKEALYFSNVNVLRNT